MYVFLRHERLDHEVTIALLDRYHEARTKRIQSKGVLLQYVPEIEPVLQVFSSISVFDMLRDQLHMVFYSITASMTGKVSLDRVTEFLREVCFFVL